MIKAPVLRSTQTKEIMRDSAANMEMQLREAWPALSLSHYYYYCYY